MSRSVFSTTTKIYRPLTSRPLLYSSSHQYPSLIQARPKSGVTQEWEGSSGEKHTTHRNKKEKDTTDPQTIASSRTMADREENYGVGNTGVSNAATERGGRKNEREVKKDHPKAPEPVLGINDERAQKGV
ncbi:hypothetical protein BJX99DRAFT_255219 [Aspergillus californicus]